MVLRRGSNGPEVEKLQARLRELGFNGGPPDGLYGGGTESAVKAFQRSKGQQPDGVTGPKTWSLLFPSVKPPLPALAGADLSLRCLALSASFETGWLPPACFSGIAGDFDGQGISFGALQWNVGQNTLQPILRQMVSGHRTVCSDIFQDHLPTVESMLECPLHVQSEFVRRLQNGRGQVLEPWAGMLRRLGATPECQAIQSQAASSYFEKAKSLCREYGLRSQRGLALMFDIAVQNGGISRAVRTQILRDFTSLPPENEVARMNCIAERRAAAALPRFRSDVLSRKQTIANGRGTVHLMEFNLEEQFALTLVPHNI